MYWQKLGKYFPNLTLPYFVNEHQLNVCCENKTFLEVDPNEYGDVIPMIKNMTEKPGRIHLTGYCNAIGVFKKFRSELRREFALPDKYTKAAERFLSNVTTSKGMKVRPVLVGVHPRRTNYEEWLYHKHNTSGVGGPFFRRAMDALKQRLAYRGSQK